MQYEKTKEKTEGDAAQRYKGIKESNKVRRKNRMFVKSKEGRGGRGREMKRQSEGHIVWVFCEIKKMPQQRHAVQLQHQRKWATSRTHTHVHTHAHIEWGEDVFSRTQMSEDKLRQC